MGGGRGGGGGEGGGRVGVGAVPEHDVHEDHIARLHLGQGLQTERRVDHRMRATTTVATWGVVGAAAEAREAAGSGSAPCPSTTSMRITSPGSTWARASRRSVGSII